MLKLEQLSMLPTRPTSTEEPSGLNSQDKQPVDTLLKLVPEERLVVKSTPCLLETLASEPSNGPSRSSSRAPATLLRLDLAWTRKVDPEALPTLNSQQLLKQLLLWPLPDKSSTEELLDSTSLLAEEAVVAVAEVHPEEVAEASEEIEEAAEAVASVAAEAVASAIEADAEVASAEEEVIEAEEEAASVAEEVLPEVHPDSRALELCSEPVYKQNTNHNII